MFFRKKGKMDELKKTDQEQVEELTDDQLESVAGGAVIGVSGVNPGNEVVVDDAYGKFEPMPEMRD